MAGKTESATYTHGHHPSVLRSHSWRTAENSAAYLLPHLRPDMKILDIGCGPGTITVGLAERVPQGHVTGLERAGAVLDEARALAARRGVANVDFVEGDANGLAYADGSFDVVVCHQVLQHVRDPVAVLREMHRVARPGGGVVAAREADFGAFAWHPSLPGLDEWRAVYSGVARRNGGEPDAGRLLHVWARRAGLGPGGVRCSSSTWCYSDREDVAMWSETWADRIAGETSSLARSAVEAGAATREDLERIAGAWRAWGEDEDAWISVLSAEILYWKK